jgi:hypothetical protein
MAACFVQETRLKAKRSRTRVFHRPDADPLSQYLERLRALRNGAS